MDSDPSANPLGGEEIEAAKSSGSLGGAPGWLSGLVLAGCALYAVLFLYHGIRLVLYPFDVDNSEAYLVYQGERIAKGQFLYPLLSEPPYLVDNYPPVYPVLTALGFVWSEPNFHWPRAIAFVSTCVIALLLGYWTWILTRQKQASLLSTLVFLSFYHVYDWGALARVDTLGIAFAVGGLVILEKRNSWKMALFPVLLALFTRQTLWAAPWAIYCTLRSTESKSSANRFGVTLLLCVGIFGGALLGITSGRIWNHLVLYNANEYRLSDLYVYFNQWARLYMVWGCAPLVILLTQHPVKASSSTTATPLLFWYTVFAFGEALLCGKIGSAPNYLLSLVAATSVGIGYIFAQLKPLAVSLPRTPVRNRCVPFALFLCAMLFQLYATWHWPHSRMDFSYTPTRQDTLMGKRLVNDLARVSGPILADRAGIPLLAGSPPVFQPFVLTQLVRSGRWDQSEFLKSIASQSYACVLLHFNLEDSHWDRERFTPEMIQTLRDHYQFERQVGKMYYIYRPTGGRSN